MESFLKHPGVEIGAVCDVYQPRLEKGIRDAGGKAKAYKDFRQVLDDKDYRRRHLLDVALWAMKADGPRVITAAGGKYSIKDNRETPDTLQATYEFPDFVCTYEIRDVSYYAYTAKHHCNVAPPAQVPFP
jgi:predicted dehydrogenase